jgi:hypothetical protein
VHRSYRAWVVAALVGFLALVAGASGPLRLYWRTVTGTDAVFASARFDPATWRAARADPGGTSNPRGPMVEDLRRRLLHRSMSKAHVRRLLGPSDNSEYEEQRGIVDIYCLGCWTGVEVDLLVIHYDGAGSIVFTELTNY